MSSSHTHSHRPHAHESASPRETHTHTYGHVMQRTQGSRSQSPAPLARSWPALRAPSPAWQQQQQQQHHTQSHSQLQTHGPSNGGTAQHTSSHSGHSHHSQHHTSSHGYHGNHAPQQQHGQALRRDPSAGSRRSSSSSSTSYSQHPRERTLAQARRASSSLNQSTQSITSVSTGARPKRVIVTVRLRPPFISELQSADFQEVVRVNGRKASVAFEDHRKEFVFDDCFGPDVTQGSVYERVGRPIVDNVMRGINGTIFVYGQTGTGKTHTMGLLRRLPTDPALFDGGASTPSVDREQGSTGIVARALWDIFERIGNASEDEHPGVEWEVTLTFVQLYCESLQNLLDPSVSNLAIREDPRTGFYVEGLTERLVSSYKEAAEFVNAGLENRMIGGTMLNTTSSRSHVILTATVSQFVPIYSASTGETFTRTFRGKLALVDLAGCERVSHSRSEGMRLDEAKAINKSLTLLGNVIASLADRRSPHVSYRSSKLTTLLQDSLGGNAMTSLVATVSTGLQSRRETVSAFLFAQRCMAVRTRAIINDETDREGDVRAAELEQRLAMLERDYQQRESQLVAQHEATVRQLTESLHMLEATPRGVKPEPIPQTTPAPAPVSSLPVMTYCYRLLMDIYARTRVPIQDSKVRATERANEATQRASSRIVVGADGEPLSAVDVDLMAGAVAMVEENYPSMLGPNNKGGLDGGGGPVAIDFPKIDEIDGEEQLLSWLRKVHASVAGNLVFCSRMLEHTDEMTARMREDLVRHEVAAARREVELENWGTTLKDLLNTNAALLARITRLQHEQSGKGGADTVSIGGGSVELPSSASGMLRVMSRQRSTSASSSSLGLLVAGSGNGASSNGGSGVHTQSSPVMAPSPVPLHEGEGAVSGGLAMPLPIMATADGSGVSANGVHPKDNLSATYAIADFAPPSARNGDPAGPTAGIVHEEAPESSAERSSGRRVKAKAESAEVKSKVLLPEAISIGESIAEGDEVGTDHVTPVPPSGRPPNARFKRGDRLARGVSQ
eukprot:Opistho-2@20987